VEQVRVDRGRQMRELVESLNAPPAPCRKNPPLPSAGEASAAQS
jgi:hypothetical protein